MKMKKRKNGTFSPMVEVPGEPIMLLAHVLSQKIVGAKIAFLPVDKTKAVQRKRIFLRDPNGIEIVHRPGDLFSVIRFFKEEDFHQIEDFNPNFMKKEIINDPLGRKYQMIVPVENIEEIEIM